MTHAFAARTRARLLLVALAVAAAIVLLQPALAFAHAVVFPKASTPGAYERYLLRVPNERAVATTRIELRFPAEARVTSFGEVAGWQLEVLTDSAKRIVGAVWTGTLAPQRFVELPFVAVNPRSEARLVWPAIQSYADGERVEWTGAAESKRPASVTTISAAPPGADSGLSRIMAGAALVVALVALGLVLRSSGVRAS